MKMMKVLSFTGVLLGGLMVAQGAQAITFRDSVDVQFDLDETLSLVLSSRTLSIDNLMPGNYGNSNTINLDVSTNSAYGYTLSARVGGEGQTDASNNLVNSSSTAAFNSLGLYDSLTLPSFNANTWGYTTAGTINNNTLYSGLPYYDSKTINMTKNRSGMAYDGYPGTNTTNFTIGAKASSSQAAGEYSNVITFSVVGNVIDDFSIDHIKYMQDFYGLNSSEKAAVLASMNLGGQFVLTDSRDGKQYYVSKLADGNVWMTQNLDFDIDSSKTYTPADTDIPANWTPSTSTHATGDTTWDGSDVLLESYDPGNLCWDGVLSLTGGDLDTATTACADSVSMHYHIGNYYNWTAAIAMNDSGSYTVDNTDVNQSICPAGWMLPKSGTEQVGSGSFYDLVNKLGLVAGMSGNIQDAPVFFNYSSGWSRGGSGGVSTFGFYQSSVVHSGHDNYILGFDTFWALLPQRDNAFRSGGNSVRCVLR